MRILLWVPYPKEGASNRYRVEQYIPYLKRAGIEYSLHPFWTTSAFTILYRKGHYLKKTYFFILGSLFRISDLFQIFKYDLILIHREAYPLGSAFFESILTLFKKPYIFDFDDAIFLPFSSHSNSFMDKFKNPNKIINIIKMSSYVIAGNSYLANFALRYNRLVSIIPTSLDTQEYCPVNKKHSRTITIGWIGSITTSAFLDLIKNVFIRLSKEFGNITFKIIGSDFFISGLSNIVSKPWSLENELNELRTFDIGIMPMLDNEWTKGKCGFKAILYMGMGIPCVCSSVGVNKEIIIDGVNGLLADSENEWIEKLSLLIKNSELRQEISLRGRKTVEEKYSTKINAPKFLGIIQRVYNEKHRR